MYLKVADTGSGLSLTISSRQPRWLAAAGHPEQPPHTPLVLGPFRGRTRMAQALDLLHECYPIRRCPRGSAARPCIRLECGDCLGPCTGERQVVAEHDALVMDIVAWLGGPTVEASTDPLDRADRLILSLSRQRRFEDAQRAREAKEQLLNIRRSYQSLAEAMSLRFAALWPVVEADGSVALRLNLIWDGRLQEAVSVPSPMVAQEIEKRLDALWAPSPVACGSPEASGRAPAERPAVVLQKELDGLLAIRRWFKESEVASLVVLPGPHAEKEQQQQARERLLTEGWRLLASWPAGRAAGSLV